MSDPGDHDSLSFQMDLLKLEIETINKLIEQLDAASRYNKNWLIITWAGSLGLLLQQNLHGLVGYTALLPMAFWVLDGLWRRIEARAVYRMSLIRNFVNGDDLLSSWSQRKLVNFRILDPVAKEHRHTREFRDATSIRRTLFYKEVWVFYVVLLALSLMFHWMLTG